MKVETIAIRNFRGIRETVLGKCGDLNVLIGQNNSGKSTVLDAIDAFFRVLSNGPAVSLDPPIGIDTDFHRAADSSPIDISVQLSLSDHELHTIVEEVSSEAPQMKHAVEGLPVGLQLRVSVIIPPGPPQFAYVSALSLVNGQDGAAKTLFGLSSTVAQELADRAIEVRKAERRARDLQEAAIRIDPDDFQMFKERGTSLRGRTTFGRYASLRPEVGYELESILQGSADFGEFRSRLDALGQSALETAEQRRKSSLDERVQTFAGDSDEIPRYGLDLLQRIGGLKVLHLRDRREPVGRDEAKRLLALKVRRGGPEILRNIQETVRSLLGVNIDAFESQPDRPEPAAEMDVDEFLVEMNGAGIREALRLLLDCELTQPDVLLVEEPEVHLHPALEISMLRYLKARCAATQTFVTTHSTNFLDTAEMRNVYLITKGPTTPTRIKLIDYEEAEESVPSELGIRLSSLFMYDQLVFVEGPSDEAVLRELASTLGVNLSRSNVGFVIMGGSRNFTHYTAGSTIDFLTRRNVRITFILDRDEASDDEVASYVNRLGDHAQVYVLKRREIENYLMVPRALAALIAAKRLENGDRSAPPSLSDVQTTLNVCADELKTLVAEKRVIRTACRPIYMSTSNLLAVSSDSDSLPKRLELEVRRIHEDLDLRLSTAQTSLEVATQEVEQEWEMRALDIVPGDELLDLLFRRFHVRFKKDRDASRLAALLESDEIADELTDLVASLDESC